MKTENFEDTLNQMTRPEVSHLKHQDMLANAIIRAKDRSVLSAWWLSIPLYIIAAFTMKSLFMRNTTLIYNIHEYAQKEKYSAMLFFIIVPIAFIILNIVTIKKIHFLSGSPKTLSFFEAVWFNVLIIIASLFILIIYSL